MPPVSYSGYRFPRDIIQCAVWMYLRFTLSFRDVEELLAERGIEVTYESIRRWVLTFGPPIARRLRARRPKPHSRWHLDELVISIQSRRMYLWLSTVRAKLRSPGRAPPGLARHEGRSQAHAQAAEEAGHGSGRVGHG
jgi:transposase-like protein